MRKWKQGLGAEEREKRRERRLARERIWEMEANRIEEEEEEDPEMEAYRIEMEEELEARLEEDMERMREMYFD